MLITKKSNFLINVEKKLANQQPSYLISFCGHQVFCFFVLLFFSKSHIYAMLKRYSNNTKTAFYVSKLKTFP